MAAAIKSLKVYHSPASALPPSCRALGEFIESGYPVILAGTEGALGWVAGLDLLEAVKPEPGLFPNGNRGMPIALGFWSEQAAGAPVPKGIPNPHAGLISRQLEDGRQFLQGPVPGLADVESFIAISSQTSQPPDLEHYPKVKAWQARMAALLENNGREQAKTGDSILALEHCTLSGGVRTVTGFEERLPPGLDLKITTGGDFFIAFRFQGREAGLNFNPVDFFSN